MKQAHEARQQDECPRRRHPRRERAGQECRRCARISTAASRAKCRSRRLIESACSVSVTAGRHGVEAATFADRRRQSSHRPAVLRERAAVDAGDVLRLLGRCRESGMTRRCGVDLRPLRGCAWRRTPATAQAKLTGLLAEARRARPRRRSRRSLHALTDQAALRYAFAVAASLESQVVGEPQVLGQVKELQQLAQHAGMSGPELDAHAATPPISRAKRVRHETGIAEPVGLHGRRPRSAWRAHAWRPRNARRPVDRRRRDGGADLRAVVRPTG